MQINILLCRLKNGYFSLTQLHCFILHSNIYFCQTVFGLVDNNFTIVILQIAALLF